MVGLFQSRLHLHLLLPLEHALHIANTSVIVLKLIVVLLQSREGLVEMVDVLLLLVLGRLVAQLSHAGLRSGSACGRRPILVQRSASARGPARSLRAFRLRSLKFHLTFTKHVFVAISGRAGRLGRRLVPCWRLLGSLLIRHSVQRF